MLLLAYPDHMPVKHVRSVVAAVYRMDGWRTSGLGPTITARSAYRAASKPLLSRLRTLCYRCLLAAFFSDFHNTHLHVAAAHQVQPQY
jgi:hypothetical protein